MHKGNRGRTLNLKRPRSQPPPLPASDAVGTTLLVGTVRRKGGGADGDRACACVLCLDSLSRASCLTTSSQSQAATLWAHAPPPSTRVSQVAVAQIHFDSPLAPPGRRESSPLGSPAKTQKVSLPNPSSTHEGKAVDGNVNIMSGGEQRRASTCIHVHPCASMCIHVRPCYPCPSWQPWQPGACAC